MRGVDAGKPLWLKGEDGLLRFRDRVYVPDDRI